MDCAFTHYLITVAPLVVGLWLLYTLLGTDQACHEFFRAFRHEHPGLTPLVRFITDWGNPLFYAVYAALLLRGVVGRDKKLVRFVFLYILVQVCVSLLLVRVLKITLGRPRPGEGHIHDFFSFSGSYNSLPSGHTTEITTAATPLALWGKKIWLSLGLGAIIALVALSRIYLGWHHPSDVLFGLILGSWGAWLIHVFGWNKT
ncbi:MAG: phosphatase PAP2 family protein [Desulfovibrio sp.]|nr:MAG: phosphatase PAP2 family protein [Desulfovibrio sp.]